MHNSLIHMIHILYMTCIYHLIFSSGRYRKKGLFTLHVMSCMYVCIYMHMRGLLLHY